MKRTVFLFSAVLCLAVCAWAQPRPVEKAPSTSNTSSYLARYEGGIFGSSQKEKGSLKFDDENLRVVFYRADGKEMFTIPYEALVVIYPDSTADTPQSGKVLSKMPVPGAGLFDLLSKNSVFASLTFDDPDIDAKGIAKFRFDTQPLLVEFIHNLGTRAKMVQRGDAYYRPKKVVF
jgi:hypothetical protein